MNYDFRNLFRFRLSTTTVYSTVSLRFAKTRGFTAVLLSSSTVVRVLGRPTLTIDSVQGFPFWTATIGIFSRVQIVVLGVLGQYIGRKHFDDVHTPTYTIAERTESK